MGLLTASGFTLDMDRTYSKDSKEQESSPLQEKRNSAVQISDDLLKNRFSCRYYLPKPVPKEIIHEIIDAARHSPSGNNIQPWEKVYCISGDFKDRLSKELVDAHKTCPEAYSAEYHYYPPPEVTPPLYGKRRFEFGKRYYGSLGIDQGDLEGRSRVLTRQFEFFDAPVAFVFTINKGLTQGSWMDVGYFLQSFTIAARARGLETVSQVCLAKYQLIFRKHLPISEEKIVVCGLSMGYPDLEQVEQCAVRQPKRPVEDIIQYFGI